MQIVKKYLTHIALVVALLSPVAVAGVVSAADVSIQNNLCSGANLQFNKNSSCDTGGATEQVNKTVKLGINVFSWVVGVAAVIMIIIGGLKYITSSGDSNNITSAKNTILYAIIGLVIVALAQFIVKFTLNATGATN